MNRSLVLATLLVLVSVAPGQGQRLDAIFEEANAAYFRADYQEAADAYARLEEAGVSDADVSFNRASSHAQLGQWGHAIQHFERALWLRPGDADATEGLEQARRALARRITDAEGEVELSEHRGFGEAVVRDLSEGFLAITALVLWALIFLALGARKLFTSPRLRLSSAIVAVLAAVSCTIFGGLLAAKRGFFHEGARAVVLVDHDPLLEGPDPRATSRGEAREGEQASIVDRDGDYVHVELSGGRAGWVSDSSVGAIASE